MSDELWDIAEREGWAHFLGDGADQWQRVTLRSSDTTSLAATATDLIQNFSKALAAAGCPYGAEEVFSNNVPGQNNGADRIYFFPPAAAKVARDVLRKYSPEPCQQPDVGALRKISV